MNLQIEAGWGRWLVAALLAATIGCDSAAAQQRLAAADGVEDGIAGAETRSTMKAIMGGVLPPPSNPSQLPEPDSAGAQLLQTYCVQCHGLPGPGLHAAQEWPQVVSRMVERMERLSENERVMRHVTVPSSRQVATLTDYLQRHAFAVLDPADYPDLDTPAGQTFAQVCSGCHAVPDPKLHSVEQWREVVLRMRENMHILGMEDPGSDALAKVIAYLQSHAPR